VGIRAASENKKIGKDHKKKGGEKEISEKRGPGRLDQPGKSPGKNNEIFQANQV